MKGKKSLIFIVLVFFLGVNCYSANDFKILKTPTINVKTGFVIPTQQSLRNESPSVLSEVKFDFYSLYGDAAFYLTNCSTDTVLSFMIKPLSLKYFEIGAGFKYHLYDYFESFLENDFLFNQYLAFKYRDILKISLDSGYNFKLSIFKNNKLLEPVFYKTLFMGFNVFWNINKSIMLYAGLNTMSDFDFSLIGTPFYNLGFDFKIKENLILGFNYEVKMIDMVAVAETISEMLLTIYMKVSL